MFRLPRTATAPFCPSEVRGSVQLVPGQPLLARLLRFTSDRRRMGRFANGPVLKLTAGALFVLISGANGWLLFTLLT